VGDLAAVSGAGRLYVRERRHGTSPVAVDAEDAYAFAVEFVNGAIGTFDLKPGRRGPGRERPSKLSEHRNPRDRRGAC